MEFKKCNEGRKMRIVSTFLSLMFLMFIFAEFVLGAEVSINAQLISPNQNSVITRHPQIIIKYPSDVTPIISFDSLRFIVNNVDYTNYMRIDLNTPEAVLFFYSSKPLNLGVNKIVVRGKLINDDTFENVFTINVNPRLSKEVAYYLDLLNKTSSNVKKSTYYYNLGVYYEKNGYMLDAIGYYNEAYKADNTNKEAKEAYERLISLFPNKALKLLNITLDVSLINVNVLSSNNIYIFRCIVENYRDRKLEFNLNNFLISTRNSYYQPIKNPYEYLRNLVKKNILTIDDFAISNYLLSKDVYYFEYPDIFVVDSYQQLKVDLMFHFSEKPKNLLFQFFKPLEVNGRKKELPVYFKLPFTL